MDKFIDVAPRHAAGLTIRRIGDELIVHDRTRGRTHALSPVAAAVFQSIDGVRTRTCARSRCGRRCTPG